jgi:hypothetical protein
MRRPRVAWVREGPRHHAHGLPSAAPGSAHTDSTPAFSTRVPLLCCGAVTRARFSTQDAYDCYKSRGVYEGGKSDYASFETLPLAHTDNHMWHHLVMTTKGHGKGMNMFIDGKLEATMPRGLDCENEVAGCVGLLKYSTIDGVRRPYSDPAYFFNAAGAGGDPIDPVGDIRLCGRQIGGAITNSLSHTGDEDFAQFDPRRYFRGQVAHFALWDSPLSQHQVSALLEEYRQKYLLPLGYNTTLAVVEAEKASLQAEKASLQVEVAQLQAQLLQSATIRMVFV